MIYRRLIIKGYWILICFYVMSCTQTSNVKLTLDRAGDNYVELENFLLHYAHDKQKKQAAEFLVSGMMNKHSYSGSIIDKYDTIFHIYDSLNNIGVFDGDHPIIVQTWDSLVCKYGRISKSVMKKNLDCQSLSANFLIENVEQAFSAWQSAPDYVSKDFNDFCEFVLPYKASDEVPERFREQYFKEFSYIRDTAKIGIEGVLRGLNQELYFNRKYRSSSTLWKYPITFPVSKMELAHRGACRHTVALYTWIMRSCGLPVAIDHVKSWGNRSQGHEWNVLMLDSGRIYPFDSFGIKKLEFAYKPAKIFRKMYSLDHFSEEIPSLEDVPGWLMSPDELDVTSQYGNTYNISVDCTHPWKGDYSKKHGVICVFDNKEWIPVYWGKYKDNKMTFMRMMGDVCYMAAYYDDGKIIPASSPFILQKDGIVQYLGIDKKHLEDITLKRKYPRFKRMDLFSMSIHRSNVEASNNKLFTNSTSLFHILDGPIDIIDSLVNLPERFRYVRIRPVTYRPGDIAEIEFFGKKFLNDPERKLTGSIFGFPSISSDDMHPYTHAMDNDYGTYFSKPKNSDGYVGLDLGAPYYITRVRFCTRSDSNFIVPGQKYELCYWDEGKWVSAGKKVATDITIDFKAIPQHTFYILHNLTEGKEERIFTYENGQQVWW